ncbi:MAG: GAF domain-containing protein [Chloroflexi bacterium]|nr:GAF domain-containing protein [Chloroflexota bacterium]
MSLDQGLQYLAWAVFVLIFLRVSAEAVRSPLRANVDMALLFLSPSAIIAIGLAAELGLVRPRPIPNAINVALLLALPYLLLRLVDDFAGVAGHWLRMAEASLIALALGAFVFPSPRPAWHTLASFGYFVGLVAVTTVAFVRTSRRSRGVTRRRLQAVSAGSTLLGLAIVSVGLRAGLPAPAWLWSILLDVLALGSGIAYYLGFATPTWVRRAWQEPELRGLLRQSVSLPRLPNTTAIVKALERHAAASLGAPIARIGLWDESGQVLELPSGQLGGSAVLAAPIIAGERKIGVLVVYAQRAPIFAREDQDLVQLLADQAAVILESHALIDEAARVRAHEEAARLKDDFLSAAAHDLKTPLTSILIQAQLLERRATLEPEAPPDLRGIRRLVREARRLQGLVEELLDASRAEHGRLVADREVLDLAELAGALCKERSSERHPCLLDASGPVVGVYDRNRIRQLFVNLIDNAVKYSPNGGAVRLEVRKRGSKAHLALADGGIGIPPEDLPHVFDRFYRAKNVDDRQFAGMGLGLFICRGIVEEHGGKIWATSMPGQGSTFHVVLPAAPGG